MRSVALSAVYLSITILQLVKFTRAPSWFSSSKTASDTATRGGDSASSSGHFAQLYWTPPPRYPEVSDELEDHAFGIFPLSSADNSPSIMEKLRHKAFIEQIRRTNTPAEYQDHLIQLGFKEQFEKPVLSRNNVKIWLRVLQKALAAKAGDTKIPDASMATSTLYGLYSLRLKHFKEVEDYRYLLQKSPSVPTYQFELVNGIDKMIEDIRRHYFSLGWEGETDTDDTRTWQKEIFYPSRGFSTELKKESYLYKITQDDEDLQKALTDTNGDPNDHFRILLRDFMQYSARKRIVILAVLFHRMGKIQKPTESLNAFVNSGHILSHEAKLLEYIKAYPDRD
ncbi:hypothetical protein PCANC_05660 [Puccinia coronata f. sp. avenae]|uniref:Uncharacterized protein n=1 Tax=Puccinia coronata f. sp. avenae TaxID=200324 RepID=A0A2N5VXW8_9BASI|nr:hypothetical protein PCANC_09837 [Puccinia coronata f. sp. avenae]PLW54835.1 hypothetical protein PCANC_05660 [Puccinia coronata f. sp. avenae]